MNDFGKRMQDILNRGVGSPGSEKRIEAVNDMHDALDALSPEIKYGLASNLLDELESETDDEVRLGLFYTVARLMKGIKG